MCLLNTRKTIYYAVMFTSLKVIADYGDYCIVKQIVLINILTTSPKGRENKRFTVIVSSEIKTKTITS